MLVWEGISSFVLVPLEFGAGPTFSSSQCFQDSQQNRNLLRQNTSHLKHPRHIMVSCRSFRSWGHFSKKKSAVADVINHYIMKHFTLPPRTSTYGLAIRSCWPKCSWPTHPTGQMGGMWGSQLGSSSKSLWAQKPCSKIMVKGYLASARAAAIIRQNSTQMETPTNKERGSRPMVYKVLFAASQALRSTKILAYGQIESQNL